MLVYYLPLVYCILTVERGLYNHSSHLLGPTADNLRNVVVELRNGPFMFLGDNYTSVAVSLPMQMYYILHFISGQQPGTCDG